MEVREREDNLGHNYRFINCYQKVAQSLITYGIHCLVGDKGLGIKGEL